MTNMSSFLENAVGGLTLCGSALTVPATIYVVAATSAASDGLQFNEVTGGSYARQRIQFSPGVAGTFSSTPTVTFPQATANWGGITHAGIYDSPTGGNQMFWGALTAVKTIMNGDTFQIPAGNLTVTFD